MLAKFLMAAGLAASFMLPGQVAEAKVKIIIGVGSPGWCYNHYDPYRCGGGGYGYYPRPRYYEPVPYFRERDDFIYERDDFIRDTMTCKGARFMLEERGYRNVVPRDCRGSRYSFFARKRGVKYVINVNSFSGRIISLRRL